MYRDFAVVNKDIKFPIDKQLSLDGKPKEQMTDVKVMLNGIQISFGPQKGQRDGFYADYADTPAFAVSYDGAAAGSVFLKPATIRLL